MAFAKSNSDHSALHSSPGRGKSRTISFKAVRVVTWPSKLSIARSKAPSLVGSVTAALGVTIGTANAPFSAAVGSTSHHGVTMP
ncbi:hypothetical protein LGR54_01590 [Ancylobacter sp. Lp-2]|uniref:hypothetical protein n=1 Tax=Ancylobacter sp. Lp-2 TaxID=2881339 RepID=UPI001E58D5B3|nr:hypothetical protein [Ancylobacter sp. Lp-2]MCB4767288.1 hypothetical protein [Ancylobacter sp. Lp-2]